MTGKELIIIRHRAGLSRLEASRRMGIHMNTLYLIEKEKTKIPSIYTAEMIKKVYGVDYERKEEVHEVNKDE